MLSVLESIEKIKIYSAEYLDADAFFEADYQKSFNATLNLLIAIGEDIKKLDESIKKKSPATPWQSIADFRNILSHNYRGVDKDIIWDIISTYLDPLKETCIDLLKRLNPPGDKFKAVLNTSYYKEIKYLEGLILSNSSSTVKKSKPFYIANFRH